MRFLQIITTIVTMVALSTVSTHKTQVYADDGTILVPQKVVEFDSRYYYGIEGYYSLGPSIHREKIQELTEQNAKLQAQLQILIDLLKNQNQTPNPTMPTVPNVVPEQPTVPEPDNGVSPLAQRVYDIFVTNCANCHGEADSDRLQLVDVEQGQLIVHGTASMADIVQRVERVYLADKKPMPPGGVVLADEDVQALKEYMYTIASEELKSSNEE